MARLGFESASEFVVFLTSLVAGMSIIMGIIAVSSTPFFMFQYYKYIKNDEKALPSVPSFWDKVLTYYTLITGFTQFALQPLNLFNFVMRFSLIFRIELGSVLMIIELLTVLLMPHTCSSEIAAVAGIVTAAFVGGLGRSLYENALYALLGPLPPKMILASMIGLPLAAVFMSMLQISLLSTTQLKFKAILNETIIYFSVAILITTTSAVLLALTLFNPFARRYVSELRSKRSVWQNIYRPLSKTQRSTTECLKGLDHQSNMLGLVVSGPEKSGLSAVDVEDDPDELTTAELLQGVKLVAVFKKIYRMLIACFMTFFVTCFIFPGLLTTVDQTNAWYVTLIIATFNVSDLLGRLPNMSKKLLISPRGILITSILRILFIPIMLLCSKHVIKGKVAPYITVVLMGMTGGYTGSAAMMYAPSLPELLTAGERSVAGQMCDISLLFGVTLGSFLQILFLSFV